MFKRSIFFVYLFFTCVINAQQWNFITTDCNMTIAISNETVENGLITFDGQEPPIGSLLGVFYINDSGEYSCAGYSPWTGSGMSIALNMSEAGFDNGFENNEYINWFIEVDGQTFQSVFSSMSSDSPFSDLACCNCFGQAIELEFISAGCSDLNACNFCDECDEFNNDLCVFPEFGYDCDGLCLVDTDGDGVCDMFEVLGCTDTQAANYDPLATDDDGTCSFILLGCNNELAFNYNENVTDNDGSCIYCNDPIATNYYTGNDGSFCVEDIINNYNLESGSDGLYDCCFYINPGCTDDGSCFDIDGDGDLDECGENFLYTDLETGEELYYESPFPGLPAANFNPNANVLAGVNFCYYFPACQDPNATNFGYNCAGQNIDSIAQENGFFVDFNELPNSNPYYINYNNSSYLGSNQANSCCIYYACTDTNAVNYLDIDALYPNPQSPPGFSLDLILSSTYFSADIPEWFNIVENFDLLDIDGDGISNSTDDDIDNDNFLYNLVPSITDLSEYSVCIYLGCMDGGITENGDGIIAYNYDPNATIDDGSCMYYYCDDPEAINYLPENEVPEDGSYASCTGIDFYDNQLFINTPDGADDCCQYLGCIDSTAFNYNPIATRQELVFTSSIVSGEVVYSPIPILDNLGEIIDYKNNCIPIIYGCMDPLAQNYNDYDYDLQSNEYIIDEDTYYLLTNINIDTTGTSLFAIDELDLVETLNNFEGDSINVNTQVALLFDDDDIDNDGIINNIDLQPYVDNNPNSPSFGTNYESDIIDWIGVAEGFLPIEWIGHSTLPGLNPCMYIYGCTDPCYIEYYDVVEHNNESDFNFNVINNNLESIGCDFNYNYGCTELFIPNELPTWDDGSCANLLVYGCMDPSSESYNPLATINDCLSCVPDLQIDFDVINPLCEGDYGSLLFSISGGLSPYSYTVYDNQNNLLFFSDNIDTALVNLNELNQGNYLVVVHDSINNEQSFSFSILDPLDFTIDIWESGGWLNTEIGYDTYIWTFDGDLLVGEEYNTFQIFPLNDGIYGVTASYENDIEECVSNTAIYNYDMFIEIDNYSPFSINYYPNPSNGTVNIHVDYNQEIDLSLEIFDTFGKLIWSNFDYQNQDNYIINNLNTGMYYMRISSLYKNNLLPIIILK